MSSRSTLPPDAASIAAPADLTTAWAEARRAYPIYAALARQFEISETPYSEGEAVPEEIGPAVVERNLRWFDEMDAQVKAFQIRQLPPATLNAKEEGLRAFIQRHLRKPQKSVADRDKIDFLLVQYFALCAPESFYHDEISLADVIRILQPVVGVANARTPDWCATLESTLEFVKECRSLRDLLESGKLDQARLVKESSGDLFYDPAALVTLARFNFLMRRAFIRLLHADQEAVLKALGELDRAGVRTVDCRRAGFTAAETTAGLRQFAENWRPLYHKDYSESAVGRSFEQLLAMRADLEEGVAKLHPQAGHRRRTSRSLTLVPIVPSQPREAATSPEERANIRVEQTGYLRKTGAESSYTKSEESLAKLGAPVDVHGERIGRERFRGAINRGKIFQRGRGGCAASRFLGNGELPGNDLGAIDRDAAHSRALDVHDHAEKYESAAVVVGSGGICGQGRTGIGRFAARGGSPRDACGSHGFAEAIGRIRFAAIGAGASARGGFVFSRARGKSEAGEEY